MTVTNSMLQRSGADRAVALAGYGLLFASIFTLGLTGIAGVVLAYVSRDQVTAGVRRHLSAQIVIFWIAFSLGLVGILAGGVGFGLFVSDVLEHYGEWPDQSVGRTLTAMVSEYRYSSASVILIPTGVVLWLVSAAVSLIAPAVGAIRLATTDTKGVTALA
jgi:uncharacterized membrane protein